MVSIKFWRGKFSRPATGYECIAHAPAFDRGVFEPWPGPLCCVLGQDTILTVALSNLMLEITLRWTNSHPGRSRNISSRFMQQKPEIRSGLMDHLCRINLFLLRFSKVWFSKLKSESLSLQALCHAIHLPCKQCCLRIQMMLDFLTFGQSLR